MQVQAQFTGEEGPDITCFSDSFGVLLITMTTIYYNDYNLNCLKLKMAERTHADGDSASAFRISRSQASRAPVSLTTPAVSDQRLRSYAVTKALGHTGAVLPSFTSRCNSMVKISLPKKPI